MRLQLKIIGMCLFTGHSMAQNISKEEVRQVYVKTFDKSIVKYKYVLNITYPNAQKEKLDGVAYINKDNLFTMNTSNFQSYVYSKEWYLNANHVDKTISIMNLNKRYSKEYKASLEHDLFKGGIVNVYTDSVLLKHGYIAQTKVNADTAFVSLRFKENLIFDYVNLVYLRSSKQLISYEMKVVMPENGMQSGKKRSYINEIKCSDFNYQFDSQIEDLSQYFTINNGTVELKKFKNYKLYTKL